jgi:predicted nucleotidyltransferase
VTDYSTHIIYSAVVGSTAYGLAVEGSDIDRRGIYLAPTRDFWSLTKPPEQITPDKDTTYWEAEKFIRLALQGNPTVLEVLWAEDYEVASPGLPFWCCGEYFRVQRHIFIGQHIMQPYIGYATDQMHRFKKRYERTGEGDTKHLMHCVRLLIQGRDALLTGEIPVIVPKQYRGFLLSIRRGEVPIEDVQLHTTRLLVEIAETGTQLPEKPDYDAANRLLAELREAAL